MSQPRPHFTSNLLVESISPNEWQVARPLTWSNPDFYRGRFTVPVGVRTNFGSIPWIANIVGLDDDDFAEAYTLHDYLYQTGIPQAMADGQLYLALVATGCARWRAWIVWAALWCWGGFAWRACQRKGGRS